MKILVRLPNWLGDMVMSAGVMHQLPYFFPGAEISVIAKKGIHELLEFFPATQHQFIFNKETYPGLKGLWQFGRTTRQTEKFDLFISLPDSFSSALMGYATGAAHRTGYKKEGRSLLLTHSFNKPKGLHRVEEYIRLLELYTQKKNPSAKVFLQHAFTKQDHLVVNINSEASSRRLTPAKAVEIINAIRDVYDNRIILIGGKNEKVFVDNVFSQLRTTNGIESMAGQTSLKQLCQVLASAQWMLSTDSGPAHLSNALGTKTIVLFGAGNENNTAPYNKEAVKTIRLGKLSCEPCTRNTCVQFGTPQCLELLEVNDILSAVMQSKNYGN